MSGKSYSQRIVDFEVTQAIICDRIACRSAWIYREEKKPQPNRELIEQWEAERRQLLDELHDLDFNDALIDAALEKHGPLARAEIERKS